MLVGCGGSAPGSGLASGSGASPSPPPAPSIGTGPFVQQVPAGVADLPLTDDAGRATSLSAYQGKVVILTDFLTLCQDVCPITSANYAQMAVAVRAAGLADRVQFVELTVDPERDTPARLHAYRGLFAAAGNWSLLTGSPDTVAKIWKYFGAWYQKAAEGSPPGTDWLTGKPLTYDVDHEDVLVFLDEHGQERFAIAGLPSTGSVLPPTLFAFLDGQGRTHLLNPQPDAWTVQEALSVLSWLVGTEVAW